MIGFLQFPNFHLDGHRRKYGPYSIEEQKVSTEKKDGMVCVKPDIHCLPWEYVRNVAVMGLNVSHYVFLVIFGLERQRHK